MEDQTEERWDLVEAAYDELEATLLELIERITDNRRTGTEKVDSISPIRPALAEVARRKAFTELRERASRADPRTAAGHSCGNRVNIGLLPEPACPHCGVGFEDTATESGWWRTTHTSI